MLNRQPRRQPMSEGSFSLSFVQTLDGLNGRISSKHEKKLRAALFSSRESFSSTVKKYCLQPACTDRTRCFSLVLKMAPATRVERSNQRKCSDKMYDSKRLPRAVFNLVSLWVLVPRRDTPYFRAPAILIPEYKMRSDILYLKPLY